MVIDLMASLTSGKSVCDKWNRSMPNKMFDASAVESEWWCHLGGITFQTFKMKVKEKFMEKCFQDLHISTDIVKNVGSDCLIYKKIHI